nr:MAG TPA: hypothetical protein [Caudoviricetes sp.]
MAIEKVRAIMAEEKDIDVLYGKVNKLDVRVTKLESTRPYLEEMIERDIKSNEHLAETLQDVQVSMTKMNTKMDENAKALEEMREQFSEASKATAERIDKIDKDTTASIKAVSQKVDGLEDKTKFDILDYIKKNWPLILILLGIGGVAISSFFKV